MVDIILFWICGKEIIYKLSPFWKQWEVDQPVVGDITHIVLRIDIIFVSQTSSVFL